MSANNLHSLLSALAMGAKSANSLPLTNSKRAAKRLASMQTKSSDQMKTDCSDDEDGDFDDDDDTLAYYLAFPEFNKLSNEIKESMTSTISKVLNDVEKGTSSTSMDDFRHDSNDNNALNAFGKFVNPLPSDVTIDFDDPLLWESCSDACDALLERVEVFLIKSNTNKSTTKSALANSAIDKIKEGDKSKLKRMISGLADVKKPQIVYSFVDQIDNSRELPYIPRIAPTLTIQASRPIKSIPGHGLMYSFVPDDVVAPCEHYDNPFREEIEGFKYNSWQLLPPNEDSLGKHGRGKTLFSNDFSEYIDKRTNMLSMKGCAWIDGEQDLTALAARLSQSSVKDIAIDLEAHSWRSFDGFTCLMQISVRPDTIDLEALSVNKFATVCDFLIDTLALRHHIGHILAPIFANPCIVKVMHGADSDIPWLQRDFGIYVVNLFDTGRASRALSFPSAGLAYLLSKFAGVTADKRHQLSDWRQRPLSDDMLAYARSDTHYLLDIYDKLLCNLDDVCQKGDGSVSIGYVLDESRKVCLKRYVKEAFKPSGWKKINRQVDKFNVEQKLCLESLWNWRDLIARELDESTGYVCPNPALVRIAAILPSSAASLHRLFNPIPPPVLEGTQDILQIVTQSIKKEKPGKSAMNNKNMQACDAKLPIIKESKKEPIFFEKAEAVGKSSSVFNDDNSDQTDLDNDAVDLCDSTNKITCLFNPENTNSQCWKYMSHSLELDRDTRQRGRSIQVDGLGAARASIEIHSTEIKSIQHEVENAIRSAAVIRSQLEVEVRSLHLRKVDLNETEKSIDASIVEKETLLNEQNGDVTEKDLIVPKSIREMYPSTYKKQSSSIERSEFASHTNNDHPRKKSKTIISVEQSFDYRGTESLGLLNSISSGNSSNPFFSGAARSLQSVTTLSNPNNNHKSKKKNKLPLKMPDEKRKVHERPQGLSGKTHVYRS